MKFSLEYIEIETIYF